MDSELAASRRGGRSTGAAAMRAYAGSVWIDHERQVLLTRRSERARRFREAALRRPAYVSDDVPRP